MKKHFLLKRRSLIRSEWLFGGVFLHPSNILGLRCKTECCAIKYWVNLKDFSKHKIKLSSLKVHFVLAGFTEMATCRIQNMKRNPDIIPLEIKVDATQNV